MIKIDVEGYETEVLRGAADIISTDRPVLVIEYWPPRIKACGVSLQEYEDLLAGNYWPYEILAPIQEDPIFSLDPYNWGDDCNPAGGNLFLCPKPR